MREEEDRPPRRDVPFPVCKCGHYETAHRMDLVRQVCETTACGCQQFREGWLLVRETRWVRLYDA